jgi:hypothetical protein
LTDQRCIQRVPRIYRISVDIILFLQDVVYFGSYPRYVLLHMGRGSSSSISTTAQSTFPSPHYSWCCSVKSVPVLPVEYTTLSALPISPREPSSCVLIYFSITNVLFHREIIAEIISNALRPSLGVMCKLYSGILNLG